MQKNTLRFFSFILAAALVFAWCAVSNHAGAEAADNTVYVSDVDAFLAAIAPDTEIALAPGEYNLTQAKNYGRGGGEWYHWESVFDGYELVITDLSGLTIRCEEPLTASIVTEPRYANVLRVENVSDFCIRELTAGHTVEPGSCSGGVLYFSDSCEVNLQSVRLYGCGTLGVELVSCADVRVDGSDIYECSEGCVYVDSSTNVLFENCKFYNCTLWGGVFAVYSSWDVAFINSEIFGNHGIYPEYGSLISGQSPGVYLGGLDVHDNEFTYVFDLYGPPVTVEKCRFTRQASQWCAWTFPVNQEGNSLTVADLAKMPLRIVRWQPGEAAVLPKPDAADDGKIHVSNVDEFLAAIDRDTTIYLEPGIYDLSTASAYGGYGGEHYYWDADYDGPGLVIHDLSNLTIEGAGKDQVTILAAPRYADVLQFERCANLILRGFTAGHAEAPGECSGGVINLIYSDNGSIEGCGLFGCGILGIQAMGCSNLYVTSTEIYDCSSGGAWLYDCHNVNFDYCSFHDNGGQDIYTDYNCSDINADGQPVQMDYID